MFRGALANRDAVLEHHSAFDTSENQIRRMRHRPEPLKLGSTELATRAPVVVTNGGAVLRKLRFANPHAQKCRKLHTHIRAVR